MFTYEDELREHNARLRDATGIRRGDRVLDIGCGAGQTTREAARAAAPLRSVRLVVQRDGLLLGRRLRVEGRAAAVERRLRHVRHDALEVLALDARLRERGDGEVRVER